MTVFSKTVVYSATGTVFAIYVSIFWGHKSLSGNIPGDWDSGISRVFPTWLQLGLFSPLIFRFVVPKNMKSLNSFSKGLNTLYCRTILHGSKFYFGHVGMVVKSILLQQPLYMNIS